MNNLYIAVTIKENNKFWSYALKVGVHNNLIHALEIKNIVTAYFCKTKKHCDEVVRIWNTQYKLNDESIY